jgi:6-phosphofructokinase 2
MEKGAKFVVDTSGLPLKMALNEDVFLLKPSIHELCSIAGVTSLQGSQVAEAAAGIIHKGKCQVVVVSLGAAGALLVTKNMQKQFVPPAVKTVGTVGAGDSMVAGIVYSLYRGATLEEAVQYGIACGTAATLHEGTSLCSLPEVEMLYTTMIQANNLLLP